MRYQSKLFNPEFLRSKGLPIPQWIEETPRIEIPYQAVA
jgi:cysteine synthase A